MNCLVLRVELSTSSKSFPICDILSFITCFSFGTFFWFSVWIELLFLNELSICKEGFTISFVFIRRLFVFLNTCILLLSFDILFSFVIIASLGFSFLFSNCSNSFSCVNGVLSCSCRNNGGWFIIFVCLIVSVNLSFGFVFLRFSVCSLLMGGFTMSLEFEFIFSFLFVPSLDLEGNLNDLSVSLFKGWGLFCGLLFLTFLILLNIELIWSSILTSLFLDLFLSFNSAVFNLISLTRFSFSLIEFNTFSSSSFSSFSLINSLFGFSFISSVSFSPSLFSSSSSSLLSLSLIISLISISLFGFPSIISVISSCVSIPFIPSLFTSFNTFRLGSLFNVFSSLISPLFITFFSCISPSPCFSISSSISSWLSLNSCSVTSISFSLVSTFSELILKLFLSPLFLFNNSTIPSVSFSLGCINLLSSLGIVFIFSSFMFSLTFIWLSLFSLTFSLWAWSCFSSIFNKLSFLSNSRYLSFNTWFISSCFVCDSFEICLSFTSILGSLLTIIWYSLGPSEIISSLPLLSFSKNSSLCSSNKDIFLSLLLLNWSNSIELLVKSVLFSLREWFGNNWLFSSGLISSLMGRAFSWSILFALLLSLGNSFISSFSSLGCVKYSVSWAL